MSLFIGSAVQPAATPSVDGVGGSVMLKSLQQTREEGDEAVDLVKTAAQPAADGNRLLSVHA